MNDKLLSVINKTLSKLEGLFKAYNIALPNESNLLKFSTKEKRFDLGDPKIDSDNY